MLTVTDALFYSFAAAAIISGLLVIFISNPIYSALFLALCMSVLGAIFFTLEAYFVSVAQITVYAGAVMVLFVMVVMLFDLKHDKEEVLKISPLNIIKLISAALLCGFFVGSGWLAVSAFTGDPGLTVAPQVKVSEMEKSAPIVKKDHREDEDLTAAEEAALVAVPGQAPTDHPDVPVSKDDDFGSTVTLSKNLFSNYVFEFEAVSLLLLIAIVGAVALAKSKGGTHNVGR